MRLLHHSHRPIKELRHVSYVQHLGTANPGKPNGFWVSVEGDDDWASWCTNEAPSFLGTYTYEIELHDGADILRIETVNQLDQFHRVFAELPEYRRHWPKEIQSKDINWDRVAAVHAGVIIAPYQWERRLHRETGWYYGWDCASGCIWNLDVIKSCKEAVRGEEATNKA